MTQRSWLLLAGIAAYLAYLVSSAPASLFLRALDRLPVITAYSGAGGTFWRGHAAILEVGGLHAGRLHWRVRPGALLRGRLGMDVMLDGGETMLHARVDAGRRVITVSELDALAQAWFLASLAGVQGPLDARIEANGLALTLRDGVVTGASGVVHVREVRFTGPDGLTLGDYRLALRMDGERVFAALADVSGPVAVDGGITVAPGGEWTADLRIGVREGRDAQVLRSVLAVFGSPDLEGHYRLHLSGTLD